MEVFRLWWARYVIRYDIVDQLQILASLRRQVRRSGAALARVWEQWVTGGVAALGDRGWPAALSTAGLGLISLLLLRLAAGPAVRFFRGKRAKSRVTFYQRMLRLLARRGFVRSPSSTAREFAESLGAQAVRHGPVAQITAVYERVRFGQEPLARPTGGA